jgi:hypothetical protein
MNPFRRIVTVGHNARVIVENRRPTEREETVKHRSEGDIQHDALNWRRARSNPPPACLWRLWRSVSTLTKPFHPNGIFFCWWYCVVQHTSWLYGIIQHVCWFTEYALFRYMMGASLWSFSRAVVLNCNLLPPKIQSCICTPFGPVFFQQSSLSHRNNSIQSFLYQHSRNGQ